MSIDLLEEARDGVNLTLAPLTIDQYHQMIREGILREGEPIELIRGTLLYKDRRDHAGGIMTRGKRYLDTVNKLTSVLSNWIAGRAAFLQVQGPITLNEQTESEPDCSLIAGRVEDFRQTIPRSQAVAAVFEVADSSLHLDQQTKLRLYADAAIPVYVIVNLRNNVIEVYTDPVPSDHRYSTISEFRSEDVVRIPVTTIGALSFTASVLF